MRKGARSPQGLRTTAGTLLSERVGATESAEERRLSGCSSGNKRPESRQEAADLIQRKEDDRCPARRRQDSESRCSLKKEHQALLMDWMWEQTAGTKE